jgi:DNA polymerase I-like protein with 3'-5' exonuclease and polymerase domains
MRTQNLAQVHRLERDLMPVIMDMEEQGVRVDVGLAEKAVRDLTVRVDNMQRDLNSLAGFEVNPNPSGSIADLFKPTLATIMNGTLLTGRKRTRPTAARPRSTPIACDA